jgi:hypothetical protein
MSSIAIALVPSLVAECLTRATLATRFKDGTNFKYDENGRVFMAVNRLKSRTTRRSCNGAFAAREPERYTIKRFESSDISTTSDDKLRL